MINGFYKDFVTNKNKIEFGGISCPGFANRNEIIQPVCTQWMLECTNQATSFQPHSPSMAHANG